MPLKVLIGVNLVQAFDLDTRSLSLVTVQCAKTLLCRWQLSAANTELSMQLANSDLEA